MLEATGIILSGGKNTRMGANKAFLDLGYGKIIEGSVKKLKTLFPEVIIVTNDHEPYRYLDTKIVSDIIPGMGPLSGIHAGLEASKYNLNFVIACDLPFIETELVRFMVGQAKGYDVVVPQMGDYLQPLHAVYCKTCLPPIANCLQQGISKVVAFYHQIRIKYISEIQLEKFVRPNLNFYNVNTPEELCKAVEMAKANQIGGWVDEENKS
ncbi:MAG: molybdenum cofactor guanylyltransferase [Bacillota bacterium]